MRVITGRVWFTRTITGVNSVAVGSLHMVTRLAMVYNRMHQAVTFIPIVRHYTPLFRLGYDGFSECNDPRLLPSCSPW